MNLLDRYGVTMGRFKNWLSNDLGGGPRHLKFAWVINFQKGLTVFFVLGLMSYYQNYSYPAWIYLALHGTYGICWILKDMLFPDPGWQKKITWAGALASFSLVLAPYWALPWLLISNSDLYELSAVKLYGAVAIHTLGLTLMLSSDAQKYYTLKFKRGLITDGWFSRTRNPNYLGEILIYGSYAFLTQSWIGWAIVLWVWIAVFLPNMINKDRSMSRYPEWKDYVKKTGRLLPKFF